MPARWPPSCSAPARCRCPRVVLIPLIMLAAMLAGALLLLGPALLKARFGVDEVVTTLLLNFIVLLFVVDAARRADEGPDGRWAGRRSPKVIADAAAAAS